MDAAIRPARRRDSSEQQVFEASFALRRGTGEFEDALIGALNAWAAYPHTLTFDKKALFRNEL
jgi:hypothetical protein